MTEPASRPSPESLLEHREWLRSIARNLVGDENSVDDVEQRTWLVALRNRHPVTSVRGWLRRVVRSAVTDEHRSTTRRVGREQAVARAETLPPTEHLVAQADAQRVVAEAVTKLAEPYRTTVLLRHFEELSLEEVATRMGVPRETVRTRLRRAHAQLREALDGEFGDRRAWCLALLPLVKTRPPVPIGAATAGAVLMGTKAKLAAMSVLVLVLVGGVWWAAETASAPAREVAVDAAPSIEPVPSVRPKQRATTADTPPATPDGPTVGVDVVDTSSRPVAGARVEIARDVTDAAAALADDWFVRMRATSLDAPPVASAWTSDAGSAAVAGVPAGVWRLRVVSPAFATHEARIEVSGTPAPRRIVLRPACVLVGTLSRSDGSPAVSADVFVGERHAKSDATGRYRFASLVAGAHDVRVAASGGSVQQLGSVSLPDVTQLDLRLRGGCALRGRVVDDETGAPIAGARVVFRATVLTELPRQLGYGAETVTAADGGFAWDDLPPGHPYFLWALRDGYVASRDDRSGWPSNFHLAPGLFPSIELRMKRGAVVRGRVLSADGTPVAGAVVDVHTRGWPSAIATSDATVSGADGAFHVLANPGTAMVRVRAPGARQRDFPADPWTAIRNDAIPASCKVLVMSKEEAAIDVVVDADAPAGKGVLTGTVVREDRLPAADVLLELFPVERSADSRRVAEVTATGEFRFEGLSSSKYAIRASATGCAPARVEGLVLPDTGSLDGVEVVLPRGKTISGRIAAAAGEPVGGAAIVVSKPDRSERDGPSVAVSGPDGAFVVGRLAPGDWILRASAPGLVARDVTFTAGTTGVEIRLDRALSITGVVVDAASGEPVPGVAVQAQFAVYRAGDALYRESASDASGRFVLKDLPPEYFRLWAGQAGDESAAGDYVGAQVDDVRAGAADVRIQVTRGLSIEGRVVDSAGDPIHGGWMAAYGPKAGAAPGVRVRMARIGRDGAFRLPGLASGTYDVEAGPSDADGNQLSPVRVADVQTGARDVVLRTEASLCIEGRLLFEDGTPLTGPASFDIRTRMADGGFKSMGLGMPWGKDGRFRTHALEPGMLYDLVVTQVPGRMGAIVRGIRPGTRDVDVVIATGGRIEGRVVDASGNPVPAGVNVMAYAPGGGGWPPDPGLQSNATTGADGRFALTGLADKSFRVRAGGHPSEFIEAGSPDPATPGSTVVEIRLERGVTLAGRLVDAKGVPLKAGFVRVTTPIAIDAEGRFVIRALKPGSYRLSAQIGQRVVDLGEVQAPSEGSELVVREE